MASSYDISQYLLDKSNIHDTIIKVPLYYDLRNLEGFRNEVYAPEILMDYTSLLGGEPSIVSRDEWVDRIDAITKGFETYQHFTSSVFVDLPQPSALNATRPDKATVLAQVNGNLVGKGSPDVTMNGGMVEAELTRFPELEKQGLNPWRISKYKVIKRWETGNAAVLDHAREDK